MRALFDAMLICFTGAAFLLTLQGCGEGSDPGVNPCPGFPLYDHLYPLSNPFRATAEFSITINLTFGPLSGIEQSTVQSWQDFSISDGSCNGNFREEMTTHVNKSGINETLVVGAIDVIKDNTSAVTTFFDQKVVGAKVPPEEKRCSTTTIKKTCQALIPGINTTTNTTEKCPKQVGSRPCPSWCPSISGECDLWSLAVPSESNRSLLQVELYYYFKANQIVAYRSKNLIADTGVSDTTVCYTKLDLESPIPSSTWQIPESWQPCKPPVGSTPRPSSSPVPVIL